MFSNCFRRVAMMSVRKDSKEAKVGLPILHTTVFRMTLHLKKLTLRRHRDKNIKISMILFQDSSLSIFRFHGDGKATDKCLQPHTRIMLFAVLSESIMKRFFAQIMSVNFHHPSCQSVIHAK